MATITIDDISISDDPGIITGGRDLPPHLVRDLPQIRQTPGDPISLRIARLLRHHPDVDFSYSFADLMTMSEDAKLTMLRRICDRLGIPEGRSLSVTNVGA